MRRPCLFFFIPLPARQDRARVRPVERRRTLPRACGVAVYDHRPRPGYLGQRFGPNSVFVYKKNDTSLTRRTHGGTTLADVELSAGRTELINLRSLTEPALDAVYRHCLSWTTASDLTPRSKRGGARGGKRMHANMRAGRQWCARLQRPRSKHACAYHSNTPHIGEGWFEAGERATTYDKKKTPVTLLRSRYRKCRCLLPAVTCRFRRRAETFIHVFRSSASSAY